MLNRKVGVFIVKDLRLLFIVDNLYFCEFVRELDLRYFLFIRKYFLEKVIF